MRIRDRIIGIVFIGSLFGCYQPPNLFETGRYSLTVDRISNCTIEAVSFEKEGRLVVEGKMTDRHHPSAPLSGDVQVRIVAPDGILLQSKTMAFNPLSHSRHIHPPARFRFIFDEIPPPDSVIKLSHTLRPFDGAADDLVIR